DGGDAERAWLAFSRLIVDASGSEPELATWMAKAITAGEIAGRPAEAATLAERLASRLGDRPLKIDGRPLTAREWVRSRETSGGSVGDRKPTHEHPFDWPQFAGDPDGLRGMTGTAGPAVRASGPVVFAGPRGGLPCPAEATRPC